MLPIVLHYLLHSCNPSRTFSYLVGQLSEAEGSLDGCSKTCSRQAEYVSKLTFEIEETDKKLVLEAERLQRQARVLMFHSKFSLTRRHTRLTADYNQLHASAVQNTQESRHVRASAAATSALMTRQQRQPSATKLTG